MNARARFSIVGVSILSFVAAHVCVSAASVTYTEPFDSDPTGRQTWVGNSSGNWQSSGGNPGGYLQFPGNISNWYDSYFPDMQVQMVESGSITFSTDFFVEAFESGGHSTGLGLSLYNLDSGQAFWPAVVDYDQNSNSDGPPSGWNNDPVTSNITYPNGTAVNERWINMQGTITHLGLDSYRVDVIADGVSHSLTRTLPGLMGECFSPVIYSIHTHNIRFDNVSITGPRCIPEPSAVAMSLAAATCAFHSRRGRRTCRSLKFRRWDRPTQETVG